MSSRRMNCRSSSMNRQKSYSTSKPKLKRNKSNICMFRFDFTLIEFFRSAFKDFPYIKFLGNTVIYRSLAKEVSAVKKGTGKER